MMESKERHLAPWETIRGGWRRLMNSEAGITVPEQLVRILVVGLAVAYSYILLN